MNSETEKQRQLDLILSSALKNNKKIYFLGAGGIGISALMQYFNHEGFSVSGSDAKSSKVTDMLLEKGLNVFTSQSLENIDDSIGAVFYSAAVPETNVELIEIRKKNIPTYFYSEGLGYISKNKKTIAIAGSHGKTTTTAMIAKVLIDSGLSPTVIVGSFLEGVGTNFVAGNSEWFIVEACEYNRSFHDIHPYISVITNIDNDHLDYYVTMDSLLQSFKIFIDSASGVVVADSSSKYIKDETKDCISLIDTKDLNMNFDLSVPGDHMIDNAKLVYSVSKYLGISDENILSSLSSFKGTWRRSEYKGETKSGAMVFDDYGHHPTEISTTLKGFKKKYSDKKITVLFQPHLFSRTKLLFNEFINSLSIADFVFLAPIYAAREIDTGEISSGKIIEKLLENGVDAKEYKYDLNCFNYLDSDDLLITLGAGDMNKEGENLLLKQ